MPPMTLAAIAALALGGLTAAGASASPVGLNASGFSANWPVTISHSKGDNGAFCLKLTDNGAAGFPHSGPATINTGLNGQWLSGQFQYINHLIVVAIGDQGFTENPGSTYVSRPRGGALTQGAFVTIYNGQEIDSGQLDFGKKNGC